MRVYLPATLTTLRGYVEQGSVPADVPRFVAVDEAEDSEYGALLEAADASAGLLAGPGRRLVVVAEVADPDVVVPLDAVVSVHADTEDVDPADQDPPDLAWFAAQELPELLS